MTERSEGVKRHGPVVTSSDGGGSMTVVLWSRTLAEGVS
jgi:hypothetical protein